jgi:hypothetical protein
VISSPRNPFITAITMISVATPSMMPTKEKPAITEMNASFRRERRYRQATMRSKAENGLAGARVQCAASGSFIGVSFEPMLDLAGLREAVDRSLDGKRFALAGCPDLDFDIAIGDSPRAGNHLDRQADQVGGRELGAGALVGIIVKHLEPGILERVSSFSLAASQAASPGFMLISPTSNGATPFGQMMPFRHARPR